MVPLPAIRRNALRLLRPTSGGHCWLLAAVRPGWVLEEADIGQLTKNGLRGRAGRWIAFDAGLTVGVSASAHADNAFCRLSADQAFDFCGAQLRVEAVGLRDLVVRLLVSAGGQ